MQFLLCVVSHDAGGAEIISSHVRRQRLEPLFVLEGPARAIFERKLGALGTLALEDAIEQCDAVLCGTSWQSDLEFRAIVLAQKRGKRSRAFLDHWVNYRERFTRNGATVLPDEIWVGDSIAKSLADAAFPGMDVRNVGNPYFGDIMEEIAQRSAGRQPGATGSVLYVCEPIREHALLRYGDERYWGYTEEEALRYFLDNTGVLGSGLDRIVIRRHPAETAGKYDWAAARSGIPVAFGRGRPLLEEILESDFVVGCSSMAMVVGLLAGKRVISCIPPGGRGCTLPQTGIRTLQQMLAGRAAAGSR